GDCVGACLRATSSLKLVATAGMNRQGDWLHQGRFRQFRSGLMNTLFVKLSRLDQGNYAMRTVNIHEAKTQLSKLVNDAASGESFVIAKAGKPLVRVSPLDVPTEPKRLGFMAGEITVPDDFDRMG